jgi:hypothetical protein
VTTSIGGKSVTAPAVLLAEFPDRMRLEVQDPIGGIQLLLVLNGKDFWLYRNNVPEILTGPVSKLPAGLLPNLSAGVVVRMFLARPFGDRLRKSELTDGSASFHEGSRLDTVLWEDKLPEPTAWLESAEGRGGAGARYEDYEFRSGLRYPTKIRLEEFGPEGEKREVLLAWKDWDASVPTEQKLFQIPQQENFGRKIKRIDPSDQNLKQLR